jgi:hypothetical protein
MNHWTSEQDARQLEMWSDKHWFVCGCITALMAVPYALIMLCGLMVVGVPRLWQRLAGKWID